MSLSEGASMATETANRAASGLLPAHLLDSRAREHLLAQVSPSFLLAPDGRLLWSSHVAARRLGVSDGASFIAAQLPVGAPGTQRLGVLAREAGPGSGRRLERLRFNLGFRSQMLTALCEALPLTDGSHGLMVSLIDANAANEEAFAPTPVNDRTAEMPPPADNIILTRRHDDVPVVASLAGAPAWTHGVGDVRRPIRFTFTLDADGLVEGVSPPLGEAVGEENARIIGRPLAAVVQEFDEDAADALRSAILTGSTWSGIEVLWPVANTDLALPITLSALPVIDTEQGLAGFSGFGRCHPDRARQVETPPPLATEPELPLVPPVPDSPLAVLANQAQLPDGDETAVRDTVTAEEEDMQAALEAFGAEEPDTPETPTAQVQPEPAPPADEGNVVSLRKDQPDFVPQAPSRNGLSMAERNAFREIARALGAKFEEGAEPPPVSTERAAENTTGHTPRELTQEAFPTAPEAPTSAITRTGFSSGILDQVPVGLLVLRGDDPLYANRTLLDLTGYPDFATFRIENGAQAIFRKGTMPRDRHQGFDTVVLTTREGELFPVDAHLQLTDWEGGKATLISIRRAVELEQGKALRSVALDLKRMRAEAQELRAVLDTATDGVITLDEKGRILSVNGAAEALFGLDQREIAGDSFTVLLHNDSHADALDYFEGLLANGVRSVLNDGREVAGREKKGGRIPLFMTLGRISDDEPKRYCAVLRDLTSWKRAESELTEARRSAELASAKKSDFLTKISHEIRTPMNAIIGFAEVMMEERLGPIDNPKYKEYLGDIRTSGKHVVSLVNDLLDLAKIEAGRMEMQFASTDLNAIVASCVGIIQPQANQNRVLVRSQLAQKLPPVVADERSIRQIVLNILSNATRFTESGGQVIVATALLESGEAVIRIRDTGVGMTALEIEQALEPFRQVGTRRDHGGTGLGLPLTKALVEANRANFAIRSTPGEGTLVEVTFPSTRVLAE
ncbi:MAG TPA: PAS domain S-box protein [Rhabdaerophilum sp.]|nr:PAS domain S-box protein [Rhabdaerophilum sp.]